MGAYSGSGGRDKTWIHPTALFFFLFILNAFLVSPFIGWYDSGEMVAATLCLGISHPSGQVLFHLLGKIFILLPFGTPAFRLGLLSVFCSSIASVLFWHLCLRISGFLMPDLENSDKYYSKLKKWLFALTLIWNLSLPWWRYSLVPLVYALHLLLALLVLWAVSLEKPAKWLLAFFIAGLATVFRPTQYFALPFLGLAFILDGSGKNLKSPKMMMGVISVFFLGQSTFLYLPLRSALHPAMAYTELTRVIPFLRHLFALRFSHYIGGGSGSHILPVLRQMGSHLWTDLTPIGIGLILFGLVTAWIRRKTIPAFLWIALGWGLMEALFVFTIPFPTFESHQVLLGWVFSGLFASAGLSRLFEKSHGENSGVKPRLYHPSIIFFILVLWLVTQAGSIRHLAERKNGRGAQDYAKNLLTIMDPKALYVPTEENEYFPVVGTQQSFHFREDVTVIEPGSDPDEMGRLIKEALTQGRSLYVTRKWDLPPGWTYEAKGPLLQVASQGTTQPEKTIPIGKPLAQWGNVLLQAVALRPSTVQPGGMVEITYLWGRGGLQGGEEKTAEGTSSVLAIFTDEKGGYWMKNGVFWLHDIHEPFGLSFSRMGKGRFYSERRILFIPSDFPVGNYRLMVGLQKQALKSTYGRESYQGEFYERNEFQNLEKFMGRGAKGALVQFSAGQNGLDEKGFWKVSESLNPAMNQSFAPAAVLKIDSNGK